MERLRSEDGFFEKLQEGSRFICDNPPQIIRHHTIRDEEYQLKSDDDYESPIHRHKKIYKKNPLDNDDEIEKKKKRTIPRLTLNDALSKVFFCFYIKLNSWKN